MTVWIINILILSAVTAIVMLLHSIRPRWHSVALMGLLALAGVASGFLVVVAKFEPVQHAVFPFRYDTQYIEAGATWSGGLIRGPYNAPKWLMSLAEHGRIVQTPSVDGVMGPGRLSGVAHYNPNAVCEAPGIQPRDPSTVSGVIVYRQSRALVYYAFGHSDQNALLRGAFLLMYHGVASAILCFYLRRLLRSARRRAALARVDRASILVRAAWWSIAWPAAAVLAHAFFFELYRARYYWDGTALTLPPALPLALGRAGVGAIWLGAILGSILTFYCVIVRAAAKQAASGDMEALCDACGYPVADPHDRCPECGTPRDAGTPNRRNLWLRTHTLIIAALWVFVGLLLCAPLTLPLVGALLPSPVVDAIGLYWYQLPWSTEVEVLPLLLP